MRDARTLVTQVLRELFEAPRSSINSPVRGTDGAEGRLLGHDVDCDTSTCGADDRDTLSYSVLDPDAPFSIAESERIVGILRVTDIAAINFERPEGATIRVPVLIEERGGLTTQTSVVVKILDINEEPTLRPQSRSIVENSPVGTLLGAPISFEDPEKTFQRHSWTFLAGNGRGTFAISATGQISTAGPVDFETVDSYSLLVEVTDDGLPMPLGEAAQPLSASATISVAVIDSNEAPAFLPESLVLRSVVEHAAPGTELPTAVLASDPDGVDDTLVYSLPSGERNFAIDPTTAIMRVRNTATLDFEQVRGGDPFDPDACALHRIPLAFLSIFPPRLPPCLTRLAIFSQTSALSVDVTVVDAGVVDGVRVEPLRSTGAIQIALVDVNEAPVALYGGIRLEVEENSPQGTVCRCGEACREQENVLPAADVDTVALQWRQTGLDSLTFAVTTEGDAASNWLPYVSRDVTSDCGGPPRVGRAHFDIPSCAQVPAVRISRGLAGGRPRGGRLRGAARSQRAVIETVEHHLWRVRQRARRLRRRPTPGATSGVCHRAVLTQRHAQRGLRGGRRAQREDLGDDLRDERG